MVKVLRKRKKWFVAGFGVLLIITFLFSGTVDLFRPDPRKQKIAEIAGRPYLALDADHAARDYELLRDLAPGFVIGELDIRDSLHWKLLVTEAERAGLIGERADGADPDWLNDLATTEAAVMIRLQYRDSPGLANFILSNPSFMRQDIDRTLERFETSRPRLVERARLSEDQYDLILAQLRGVTRLVNTYTRAARLSDVRTTIDAADLFDATFADALLLPADLVLDQHPAPTEQDIQAHFAAYAAAEPGTGTHGFGYVQPARVKLEWMELNRAAVFGAVQLDPLEVARHYQRNRDKFPGEYDAERPRIESTLREAKVDQVFAQFDALYKSRLKSAARGLDVRNFVRVLPDDWAQRRPAFNALAEDLRNTVTELTGVPIPLPTVNIRVAQWTRLADARFLPGIGESVLPSGARTVPFTDLLTQVHEINPASVANLQVGFPFELFLTTRATGNRYYLCVLDARTPSPPDSIDEVRDQVVRDLRAKAAYDALASRLDEFRALAASAGLDALAATFARPAADNTPEVPAPSVLRNIRVSRRFAGDASSRALDVPEFRDAVMARVRTLGLTTPPTDANRAERTLAVALPASLSVAVAQTTYPAPMTRENLRTIGDQGFRMLLREESADAAPDAENPFSLAALKQRLNYREFRTRPDGSTEPEPTPEPAPTPGA